MSIGGVIHTIFIRACARQQRVCNQVNRKVAFKALPFCSNVFNPRSLSRLSQGNVDHYSYLNSDTLYLSICLPSPVPPENISLTTAWCFNEAEPCAEPPHGLWDEIDSEWLDGLRVCLCVLTGSTASPLPLQPVCGSPHQSRGRRCHSSPEKNTHTDG